MALSASTAAAAAGIPQPGTRGSPPATARVIRSDTSGVWATPLGADTRHPYGPCRGAHRRDALGELEQLPVGTLVLLVLTDDGPWVAGWEETA